MKAMDFVKALKPKEIKQKIKNHIGDFLEYGRCKFTGDTYWRGQRFSVKYNADAGVLVSSRAITENCPVESIARTVHEDARSHSREIHYSLEEMTRQIQTVKERYEQGHAVFYG